MYKEILFLEARHLLRMFHGPSAADFEFAPFRRRFSAGFDTVTQKFR